MTRFAPKSVWTTTLAALLAVALSVSAPAIAGDGQSAPAAAAPSSPPPPAGKPGFLHELAGWWDSSIAFFSGKLNAARGKAEDIGKTSSETAKGAAKEAVKGAVDVSKDAAAATKEALKGALDVGKDAASAVVKLPNTRLVEMHERCDKAPNGAPDCAAAAAGGCRAKGFSGGKFLDVVSADNCPPPTLSSQAKPLVGECPVDTFVTRAVCQ